MDNENGDREGRWGFVDMLLLVFLPVWGPVVLAVVGLCWVYRHVLCWAYYGIEDFVRYRVAGNKTPLEKLAMVILLNARDKGARHIEIAWRDVPPDEAPDSPSLSDDGQGMPRPVSVVYYWIGGRRILEMTPPGALHERIADEYRKACALEDGLLGRKVFHGRFGLEHPEWSQSFRVRIAKPDDGPSTVFLELFNGGERDDYGYQAT